MSGCRAGALRDVLRTQPVLRSLWLRAVRAALAGVVPGSLRRQSAGLNRIHNAEPSHEIVANGLFRIRSWETSSTSQEAKAIVTITLRDRFDPTRRETAPLLGM